MPLHRSLLEDYAFSTTAGLTGLDAEVSLVHPPSCPLLIPRNNEMRVVAGRLLTTKV